LRNTPPGNGGGGKCARKGGCKIVDHHHLAASLATCCLWLTENLASQATRLNGTRDVAMSASVRKCPGGGCENEKRSAMTAGFVKGCISDNGPPAQKTMPLWLGVFRRGEAKQSSATCRRPCCSGRLAHDRQRSQLKQARSFHTAIRVVRFSIGHQRSHSTSYGNAGSFPTARLKRTSFFELSASRVGSSAF
jgi:hypothetical protein